MPSSQNKHSQGATGMGADASTSKEEINRAIEEKVKEIISAYPGLTLIDKEALKLIFDFVREIQMDHRDTQEHYENILRMKVREEEDKPGKFTKISEDLPMSTDTLDINVKGAKVILLLVEKGDAGATHKEMKRRTGVRITDTSTFLKKCRNHGLVTKRRDNDSNAKRAVDFFRFTNPAAANLLREKVINKFPSLSNWRPSP